MSAHVSEKIIIALDVPDKQKALNLVHALPSARMFKVGLRLFTSEGPPFIKELRSLGKNVFLDLKLHDIPNTVADTVRVCAGYGVRMMTLHTSGGREMMEKAAGAAAETAHRTGRPKPLLLGVTILTSLKNEQLEEIGMPPDTDAQVVRLAKLAAESGLDGVVCSPREIELVKKAVGKDFLVVTPGIRPAWAAAQDQKRILTPAQAVRQGADFLVIGRPIIADPSPPDAFDRIIQEISA